MMERTDKTSKRGRVLKRPRNVYEPPSDFEDEEDSLGEDIEDTEDEEEPEDEDTDLSGFIAADDEDDDSYVPSDEDDEDEDEDEAESDPLVVTRENLIDKLMQFSEAQNMGQDVDEAEVLARMIVEGFKFPFLSETDQLKLFPFYKNKKSPPLETVRSVFRI